MKSLKNRFLKSSAILTIILFSWVMVSFYLAEPKLNLSFEIYSDTDSSGQVYWSQGENFSEKSKFAFKVKSDPTLINISIPLDATSIRIDPLINSGFFTLKNMALRLPFCALPQTDLCQRAIKIELSQIKNNALYRIAEVPNRYFSINDDPWIILSSFFNRTLSLGMWNMISCFVHILGLSLLIISTYWFLNHRSLKNLDISSRLTASAPLLTFSPIMFLLYSVEINQEMHPLLENISIFLPFFLFLFLFFGFKTKTNKQIRTFFTFFLVLVMLLPDILFHFNVFPRPLAGREATEYHWRTFRNFADNHSNSSLKYRDEIESIDKLLPRDSIVLSDIATSYYLAASSRHNVQLIHDHHQITGYSLGFESMKDLCDRLSTRSSTGEVLEVFREVGTTHLIINNDKKNKNIGVLCKNENILKVALSQLKKDGRQIYQSQYIQVYSMR